MKLVLATPLYPPDIAGAAPYIKELATRLAAEHEVTVVAYGKHPEAIPGVRIVAVDKHRPLLLRLPAFLFELAKAAKRADAVIVENGPSVTLPAAVLAFFSSTRFILHIGDEGAYRYAQTHLAYRSIDRFFGLFSACTLADRPLVRPEILPFTERPSFESYEASWKEHLGKLKHCVHG